MQNNKQAEAEKKNAEAFLCPFCGAPYKELIPTGVVQVKCHYCGATILVPPRLGGLTQRCPNHPDVLAIGLCNECSKSYCDQCLYIYETEHGKLHLCAKCYESRTQTSKAWAILALIMSFMFAVISLAISAVGALLSSLMFLMLSIAVLSSKKRSISVREARSQLTFTTYTPKAFLKKCVQCGRDIPIASENCRYCGAKQPEYK